MRILVIGDSCVDIFKYGEVNRLAPEAPVPVLKPIKEVRSLGMAGNVVANLEALSVETEFISNDINIYKTRFVDQHHNYILLRVDENDKCELISDEELDLDYNDFDAVIVSDYCKGFLDEKTLQKISTLHPLTFLDTKKVLGSWAEGFTFIKINSQEYERSKHFLNKNKKLKEKTIITRGPRGCEFRNKIYPTKEVPVKDVSGAGDTFIAAFAAEYINTKDIEESIKYAQECTTIVVQKPGVATL
jgi:bifunctional ADP-heptose synthase (sugar kinase/adenylyltransferase)